MESGCIALKWWWARLENPALFPLCRHGVIARNNAFHPALRSSGDSQLCRVGNHRKQRPAQGVLLPLAQYLRTTLAILAGGTNLYRHELGSDRDGRKHEHV